MNGLLPELRLALEVLKRWETLAALAVFLAVWSVFRYVALVQRRPPAFRRSRPRKPPAVPAPAPEEAAEEPAE